MDVYLPVIFFFALVLTCEARPDGAPLSACSTLTPIHGDAKPERSEPPYSVTAVKSGDKVRVTISSPIGEEFAGFVLQARSRNDRNRIVEGKFTTTHSISRTIDCFNGRQNTLTQVDTKSKNRVVTEWTPSSGINENVIFRATVAKTFMMFWTEIDSEPIRIKTEGDRDGGTTSQNRGSGSEGMYDNCYITKGCFGYPGGCVQRGDCEVLLSYADNGDGINFVLKGYLESQTYMAMGLSTDPYMGDDAVTDCFRQGSTVRARESFNVDKRNTRSRELGRDRYSGEFNNGLSTCSWIQSYNFQNNGKRFDLGNKTYYVLLAKGPLTEGRLSYHSGRISTQEPVNFTAFETIEGEKVHDAVKIHGTFMVTAWVGFVSLGILLARHFKSAWENSTVCGVKIWFAFHRGFMIVALTFVVVAFIVIFVYKKGWNSETKNPHAILGCIATALGLFQPIMAVFRPAPDHPKRPVFNWMHWIVGNLAHIIAVITIFFAVSLESSGLKESFYWVMAIFVIVHLIFHFLFQVHSWTSGKKKTNEVKMLEMSSGRGNNNVQSSGQEKNISEFVFRILLLGIYSIFLVVIILALYALIGVA